MGAVKYLLDTHTLLWAVRGSEKLSEAAKRALTDINAQKFVSSVSAYEIMYKHKLGKLRGFEDVAENYLDVLQTFGADELSINTRHAHLAGKFKWSHRDPFDRLLAAQASADGLTLLTSDPAFNELPWITTLW
ncbi:MAG: type II toxin-antitoxin system VapC family toxin [Defluviitaleaceae bacterium]|nr:type II toxin-antitoxin system VapC family toxin [Defluviitaleaceae bacterium]